MIRGIATGANVSSLDNMAKFENAGAPAMNENMYWTM